MNDPERRSRIDETLTRVFEKNVPPDVEERLTGRLREFPSRLDERPPAGGRSSRVRTAWSVAAALVLAVVLALVWSTYWNSAMRMYAAAMSAIDNVGTIHAHGYGTSSMFREHEEVPEADRYEFDAWIWTDGGGVRRFERKGPVLEWDDGRRRYRYSEHSDTLHVDRSFLERASRGLGTRIFLEGMLAELRESRWGFTDRGVRLRSGREVRIVEKEVPEAKRKEWWFDVRTGRLVHETRHKWKAGRWVLHWFLDISYGEPVPPEVAGFSAPEAEHVHYAPELDPRYEAWERHVQTIRARYETRPLPDLMELLPRPEGVELETPMESALPGHHAYFVVPLSDSLRRYLFAGPFPPGSVRLGDELAGMSLNHDLVVKRFEDLDEGGRPLEETSRRAQYEFVLDALGLEIVETLEERQVWIAQYDGRRLKPWRGIEAPVAENPDDTVLRPGVRSGMSTRGVSVKEHFRRFNLSRDPNLTARKALLVDETGIPEETPLTEIAINWYGPDKKCFEIAREWFEREFGITFVEGRRSMPVYVVRRKRE